MLLITNEAAATKMFKKYKNTVAFSLAKNAKGLKDEDGTIIANYETLSFLPDEDTINGLKDGSIKLKKTIREVKKAIKNPSMDDAGISLGVAQLLTMLTANRKAPVVMVIIEDETDPARNKILVRFIKEVLGIFLKNLFTKKGRTILTSFAGSIGIVGIAPVTMRKVKKAKIFKGKKKKIATKVTRFNESTKGCRMSKDGAELKKLLLCFYELELRQSGMAITGDTDVRRLFDRDETRACVKNLLRVFTATNLQSIASKKICKRLAKKDKRSVKAYKELREILGSIDGVKKLPKVKYGQKKKKGKAIKAKMNTKKFVKFFEKKSNRPMLLLIYGHILVRLLDYAVGSKEYNAHMKAVCEPFGSDFAKSFIAAANAFDKAQA